MVWVHVARRLRSCFKIDRERLRESERESERARERARKRTETKEQKAVVIVVGVKALPLGIFVEAIRPSSTYSSMRIHVYYYEGTYSSMKTLDVS